MISTSISFLFVFFFSCSSSSNTKSNTCVDSCESIASGFIEIFKNNGIEVTLEELMEECEDAPETVDCFECDAWINQNIFIPLSTSSSCGYTEAELLEAASNDLPADGLEQYYQDVEGCIENCTDRGMDPGQYESILEDR